MQRIYVPKCKKILPSCYLKTGWSCEEQAEKQRMSASARGEGHAVPVETRSFSDREMHVTCQINEFETATDVYLKMQQQTCT